MKSSASGFLPVEGDALVLDEAEGVVDPRLGDRPGPVDQPGLVDLVLGEADRVQQAGAEVAVDHAHRRVAEHQGEDALPADLVGDLAGGRDRVGTDRGGGVELARRRSGSGRSSTTRRAAP